MRRCDPLRPIALGFLRRPINYYPWIVLVQPWLETALAGMKAVLVRAQK